MFIFVFFYFFFFFFFFIYLTSFIFFFFFQAEDGIRDFHVTGVQTCALPISVGVLVDGKVRRGFPTPSGKLEFWSRTLAEWGWREHALPGYIRSHVHPSRLEPDQMVLISTFRLPVQIHTRSANAKWLNELAHTNPLWIHPRDADHLGIRPGDLVRVETEIGHFVVKAWVTEGIRPGVV